MTPIFRGNPVKQRLRPKSHHWKTAQRTSASFPPHPRKYSGRTDKLGLLPEASSVGFSHCSVLTLLVDPPPCIYTHLTLRSSASKAVCFKALLLPIDWFSATLLSDLSITSSATYSSSSAHPDSKLICFTPLTDTRR